MTKPVIYYYFKDKDALCFEIVKNFEAEREKKLLALAHKTPDFAAFLERLFASYMDNGENKKMVAFMMHLHGYISYNKELERNISALHEGGKDQLEDMLKRYAVKPAVRDTAKHLIVANLMHMVMHQSHGKIKFKKDYPARITMAILRAIEVNK